MQYVSGRSSHGTCDNSWQYRVWRGCIRFATGDSRTRAGAESLVVADVRGVTSISMSVDVN